MKRFALLCALLVLMASLAAPSAYAVAPFKKAFQQKYVDDSNNDSFKQAFRKASCNTCHIKGEKKDKRNDYAEELSKLIEGDANQRIKDAGKNGPAARKAETEKVLKELEKAFEAVAKMKNKAGRTYGDRLKEGLLPIE